MQTFNLLKGEITFDSDKIIIVDDAKKQKQQRQRISILWIIFGTFSVLRYLKTDDQFLLWTGLIIGVGHLIVVFFTLFQTTQSEIYLKDVKSIKARQSAGNKILDIKLKNNRVRRIKKIDNLDLEKYIETNFEKK